MRVDQFDFELPERLIALRPAVPRDSARLLVVREDGTRKHRSVRDLPELLQPKDVLVVNDSKVIAARLHGVRHRDEDQNGTGAKIELLLHRRIGPGAFRALARPAKRLRPGDVLMFGPRLKGRVTAREAGEVEIAFEQQGDDLDRAIAAEGEVPLPPYIAGKRTPDLRDRTDYQTIYARISGSVAAPTAGLHFTPELLHALQSEGIGLATVTLHVGPGTFLPVTADDTSDHVMHSEWAELPVDVAEKINDVRARGGRVVAAGSTVLRTLEAASDERGRVRPFTGETDLFVTPGYHFKLVDVLLTNFHLPRSTLFMLVCAFSGTAVMNAAYAEAIEKGYRFYSYGDACLLFRARSR
jgi:S-adenosylmethionine:tRNA ribosyltransferase-isomerase